MKTATPILFFSLSVTQHHDDGIFQQQKKINVIAKTLTEAKAITERYLSNFTTQKDSVVKIEVLEVRQPNNRTDEPDIEEVINPEAFDDGVFFTEMLSLEENQDPFHHDLSNMGTSLVRDWMVMHPGYDNKENQFPLCYSYFHSRRTGARIGVRFGVNLG